MNRDATDLPNSAALGKEQVPRIGKISTVMIGFILGDEDQVIMRKLTRSTKLCASNHGHTIDYVILPT